MPSVFSRNVAGLAALLTMIWGAFLFHVIGQYPCGQNFNHDVSSPVLALEISENEADIDAVLHRKTPCVRDKQNDCQQAITNQRLANDLDLVFIPLYTFAIWSFGRLFTDKAWPLAAAAIAAGLFDYIEDWKIFDALGARNPPIYIPSLIKWGLLGLVFVGLAVILFRSQSDLYSLSTKRIMGLGYLAGGALLIFDVALGRRNGYSLIELANGMFVLLTFSNVIGLLGHYLALPGIRQKFIPNFCEERKRLPGASITAIEAQPLK